MGRHNKKWKGHADKEGSKPKQEITMDPDKRRLVPSRIKMDPFEGAIKKFEGEHDYLSNIYKCDVRLEGDDEFYPSVEHAFQASKTIDDALRERIRSEPDPIEAKKIAREAEVTDAWRAGSQDLMARLVRDKFRRHRDLRRRLAKTGHVKLVHGNDFNDQLWGFSNGKGKNLLGKLLEKIREESADGTEAKQWLKDNFSLCVPADCVWTITVLKEDKVLDVLEVREKTLVTFGKQDSCTVKMNHPSVSRLHAYLFAAAAPVRGPVLLDLGARNGCSVNGTAVAPHVAIPLEPDHVVRIGTSSRRYRVAVVTDARDRAKQALVARMAEDAAAAAAAGGGDGGAGGDGGEERGGGGGWAGAGEVRENTVYVGNLPYSITKEQLRDFFGGCGTIKNLSLPQDRDTGQSRGIAFIEFATHLQVAKALQLDGDDLEGRPVKVKRSDSKPKPKQQENNTQEENANEVPVQPPRPKIKVAFKPNEKAFYGREKVRVVGVHLDKKNLRPYYTIKMQGGRERQVLEHMIAKEPIKKLPKLPAPEPAPAPASAPSGPAPTGADHARNVMLAAALARAQGVAAAAGTSNEGGEGSRTKRRRGEEGGGGSDEEAGVEAERRRRALALRRGEEDTLDGGQERRSNERREVRRGREDSWENKNGRGRRGRREGEGGRSWEREGGGRDRRDGHEGRGSRRNGAEGEQGRRERDRDGWGGGADSEDERRRRREVGRERRRARELQRRDGVEGRRRSASPRRRRSSRSPGGGRRRPPRSQDRARGDRSRTHDGEVGRRDGWEARHERRGGQEDREWGQGGREDRDALRKQGSHNSRRSKEETADRRRDHGTVSRHDEQSTRDEEEGRKQRENGAKRRVLTPAAPAADSSDSSSSDSDSSSSDSSSSSSSSSESSDQSGIKGAKRMAKISASPPGKVHGDGYDSFDEDIRRYREKKRKEDTEED